MGGAVEKFRSYDLTLRENTLLNIKIHPILDRIGYLLRDTVR